MGSDWNTGAVREISDSLSLGNPRSWNIGLGDCERLSRQPPLELSSRPKGLADSYWDIHSVAQPLVCRSFSWVKRRLHPSGIDCCEQAAHPSG
jgi:hypothetical protein